MAVIASNLGENAPIQPSRSRKRAFSLRSQLLNNSIVHNAESYLHTKPQSTLPPTQDIELKVVESSYTPEDTRHDFNDDRSSLDLELFGNSNVESNLESIRDTDTNDYEISFFKHLFNLLTGRREILPSKGGRTIPISLDFNKTDFPIVPSKSNKPLLIDERTKKKKPYVNNLITSSRYTLISFIPRQLIAQFSKLANCYFMCVAILQLIPSWSTTGRSTTIIPLSIFISISMLREAYDDYRRHKLDKEENNRITRVLSESTNESNSPVSNYGLIKSTTSISRLRPSGQSFDLKFDDDDDQHLEESYYEQNSFQDIHLLNTLGVHQNETKWKNVKVGDIVKLHCDEWVPADIVVLTSSNEMGETFVETMALDGETNLKSKMPSIELHKIANIAKNFANIDATVTCEDPNLDLYNFEGSLNIPSLQAREIKTLPLGPENVIFRGSIIRNTECCLGLVIFTGEETKIRMNAIKNPRIKAPKLQRKINMVVAFMVFVVITISLFSFMAERFDYIKYKDKNWYTLGEDAGVAPTIMGFIIMYNTIIPLSLYVTMEIIKVVQMFLMQSDIDMYHSPSDTPAEVRTATILEELGQVSYIFSDKTGTLTDNVMLFRKFSVCGVPWIHDIDLIAQQDREIEDPNDLSSVFNPHEEKPGTITATGRPSMASLTPKVPQEPVSNLNAKQVSIMSSETEDSSEDLKSTLEFIRYIQTNPNTLFSKQATLFLLSIALCHTCLPRRKTNDKPVSEVSDDIRLSLSSMEDVQSLNPFATGSNVLDIEEDEIEYQAASPDELALVQAACEMGFILYEKKQKIVKLKTYPNGFDAAPEFTKYEILDVVEFNSTRKRMSVIVKFPNDKILMFCKGADNVIIDRLKNNSLVKTIQNQMAVTIGERQKAEAEFILNRKSQDLGNAGRPSIGSRLSFSDNINGRNNDQSSDFINSLMDAGNGVLDDINDIYNGSKKSLDIHQKAKYSIQDASYIPSDTIIGNDQFVIERTLQHIDMFSSDGLRTLLYSFKILDKDIYQDWQRRYSEAKTSLKNRSDKIAIVGEELEFGFDLLGCTAIEDKLQDGVPDAIDKLRRAGIKLWMLTGDKRETAINIGYSCKLIKDYSTVIILSNENNDLSSIETVINAAELELNQGSVAHCVLVIDGSTLSDVEQNPTLLSSFISLGVKSDSVICCRASPSQKATMVLKVRELDTSKVTLAIGDGANDIAMIQSADVGVGITGKEGLQAARTSDYSIAQFRYLIKLLFVHGRYNYIRTSQFVLCTFYKELLFYLSQMIYQKYTLFTGSSLYESWSLSMFNTLFTSLPVLCIGMFDKDLKPSTLIAVPELYSKGSRNESFNLLLFIFWVILAASQTTALSFSLYGLYGFPATMDNTTYPLGVIMFTVFIIVINTKCNLIEMHSISKICIIAWCVSVFGWCIWCMLLVGLYKHKLSTIFYVSHGLFEHFGKDTTFWGTILVLVAIGIWIDFIFQFIKKMIYTTETDEFQILEKDPILRRKFEMNSYNEMKQSWTWDHQSQLDENQFDQYESFQRNFIKFKSFLRKGSVHPSKSTQMRKRKATLVNPTELPPDVPSIVKLRSTDDWEEELLPSGKIIKVKKNSNGMSSSSTTSNRNLKKLFKSQREGNNGAYTNEDIDDIIDRRMESLH